MVHEFKMGKPGASMIITHGGRGCTLLRNGTATEIRARVVERVFDTVGAGDAFRSGLYLGLSRRMTLEDSAILGSIVSSIAIQRPISEFNTSFSEVLKIYEEEKHLMRGI
jgi:sugar/nucleoside kinase (ribokinase family)